MREPLEQMHPVKRFFIGIWACVVIVVFAVYVVVRTTQAKLLGKKYYWKDDTIK
jgi:hypothetical protein